MPQRIATIPAQQGGKYVRQLASHWGHKMQVDAEGDRTVFHFPEALVTMEVSEGQIAVVIDAAEDAVAERLTEPVARHLDRFAFREAPLAFDWRVG